MGAEGKYDLKLSSSYDLENQCASASTSTFQSAVAKSFKTINMDKTSSSATKTSSTSGVLSSRKSSSTPSLPEATDNHRMMKSSVASTEQATSVDNLTTKTAASVADSVLSLASAEALVSFGLREEDAAAAAAAAAAASEHDEVLDVVRRRPGDLHAQLVADAKGLAALVGALSLDQAAEESVSDSHKNAKNSYLAATLPAISTAATATSTTAPGADSSSAAAAAAARGPTPSVTISLTSASEGIQHISL